MFGIAAVAEGKTLPAAASGSHSASAVNISGFRFPGRRFFHYEHVKTNRKLSPWPQRPVVLTKKKGLLKSFTALVATWSEKAFTILSWFGLVTICTMIFQRLLGNLTSRALNFWNEDPDTATKWQTPFRHGVCIKALPTILGVKLWESSRDSHCCIFVVFTWLSAFDQFPLCCRQNKIKVCHGFLWSSPCTNEHNVERWGSEEDWVIYY